MDRMEKLHKASEYIGKRISTRPSVGMILGSGLGVLAESAQQATRVAYHEIPGFPVSTVEGHAGQLVCGEISGKRVLFLQGRFHYYEGYSMEEVVFPVRVMKLLGIDTLVVTNAAGGVNTAFSPGELMLIEDHIKFFDESPLRGKNLDELGPRFNDLSRAYSPALRETAQEAAQACSMKLRSGIYAYMSGPSFETPAEIRMLRALGADAVGMSTVPEVIAAGHCGMDVVGISCITNMAAGILPQPLTHQEVMDTGRQVQASFAGFIENLLTRM